MKILIIGAGSMGCPIAWIFDQAGHDVSIYVRPGTITDRPKIIEILNLDQRAKEFRTTNRRFIPHYVEQVSNNDDYNFIFVPIKHYQWANLIPILSKSSKNSTIVTIGNLWDEFEALEHAFNERLIYGFFHFSSALKGDKIYGFISSHASFGSMNASHLKLSALTLLLKNVGFSPRIRTDMKSWLICHFAFNAAFISAAAMACGLDNLIKNVKHIRFMQKLMHESFNVVKHRGITPSDYADQSIFEKIPWPLLVIFIKLLSFTVPMKVAIKHSHIDGKEIKSYYFDLLQTAKKFGIQTPYFNSIETAMIAIDDKFCP